MTTYRALADSILFLGEAVLPQATMMTSFLQQKIGQLKVKHLVEANDMLKHLLKLRPIIMFIKPVQPRNASIVRYSDASHFNGERDYGQTGVRSDLKVYDGLMEIYHLIDWASLKQKRISYSFYGAEILACAHANDRVFQLKMALNNLFQSSNMKHEVIVDSRALHAAISSENDGKIFRLRTTVEYIRNSFESEELNSLTWVRGLYNFADALTKRNEEMSSRLNKMISNGSIDKKDIEPTRIERKSEL